LESALASDNVTEDALWVNIQVSNLYACGVVYENDNTTSRIICWGEVPIPEQDTSRSVDESLWIQSILMGDFVCGLSSNGEVQCFGDSAPATLPNGTYSIGVSNAPGPSQAACLLNEAGSVDCFGVADGVSTISDLLERSAPSSLEPNLAAGRFFCAINASESVVRIYKCF